MELTGNNVRGLLNYDPDTGVFTWIKSGKGIRSSKVAGSVIKKGYRLIGAFGKTYMAHRVAFLWMTGKWPSLQVDHINMNKDDNRWRNLREVSQSTNQENRRSPRTDNKLGMLGVSKHNSKFRAEIQVKGQRVKLGSFSTPDEAHQVYLKAKRALHEGCTI